nr:ribonuclease H-like domain-containing protein [Tanacetum cinerariifolium]
GNPQLELQEKRVIDSGCSRHMNGNILEEFQQPEFEGYRPKTSNSVSEYISNEVKESTDAPLVKELVSDDKIEKKTIFPTVAKIKFVRPKQKEKPVKYAKMYSFDHLQAYCNYHQQQFKNHKMVKPVWNYNQRIMKKLMEDMLPLEVTLKEGKSQAENSVLFNDTECIVLSPNFKLTDESQVLLRVPRKNNMYRVDLKNIVPKEG